MSYEEVKKMFDNMIDRTNYVIERQIDGTYLIKQTKYKIYE